MNDLLTISEVAQILRVDGSTVRRWVKRGALDAISLPHRPHHRKRKAYRIRRESIEALLNQGN